MKEHIPFNEAKVLKLLVEGSEYAFTQVFDRYQPRVFAAALDLLKSRELAKDVVQDVFLKVWTSRAAFENVRNLEAFIFTMAKNLTLNTLRKRSNEVAAAYQYSIRRETAGNSVEHPLADQQYAELLRQTLRKLPPQQRRVYELSRLEGLTHEDIARQLNISGRTVNNHMNTALRFIRESLEPHIGMMFLPMLIEIFRENAQY
jgi:RNA polymerase sigma-70 factor (family 1)